VAAYVHGAGSQEAIDLAFKFNNCMDGVKTGLTIRDSVLRADRRLYDKVIDSKWAGERMDIPGENLSVAKRPRSLGDHVLDKLWRNGSKLIDEIKKDLEERRESRHFELDPQLAAYWESAIGKGRITEGQAHVMTDHCRRILETDHQVRIEYGNDRRSCSVSPRKKPSIASARIASDAPFSMGKFAQVSVDYHAWINDKEKAFAIAGMPVAKDDCKLQDCIDLDELQRLENLLASRLYLLACQLDTRISGKAGGKEYKAFDIAWHVLLTMKAAQKAKQEGQASTTLPASTANRLRLRPMKAAKSG
jgi:hypothetical protein